MKLKHRSLAAFAVALLVTVGVGTFVYIYEIPPLIYGGWQQSMIQKGLGGGPMPVNTLWTEPNLPNYTSTKSGLLNAGANLDTLYTVGVLDLSGGPQVLSVPSMGSRYFDIEFVGTRGMAFAYIGSRTTGGQAGTFLISGPGWHGTVPQGVTQISSPDSRILLFGRVLVENASVVPMVYSLSTQIRLTPLSSWQPASG